VTVFIAVFAYFLAEFAKYILIIIVVIKKSYS